MKSIQFKIDPDAAKTLTQIQKFFKTNRDKSFMLLLLYAISDIASLHPEKEWTPEQKKAWEFCRKKVHALRETVTLTAAKFILLRKAFDKEQAAMQLESLSRAELVELAESKGLYPGGLRKSGIVKLLQKVQNETE